MEPEDADSVAQIEKDSFTQPWSRQGFLDAMRLPENIMLVAQEDGEILGYQCTYVSFDEEVADTGIGISPEHLPHIFTCFYRADPSRNKEIAGNGLGLSIVKTAEEIHDFGKLFLFLICSGHIGKGLAGLLAHGHLGPALGKAHGFAAALRLAHHHKPKNYAD